MGTTDESDFTTPERGAEYQTYVLQLVYPNGSTRALRFEARDHDEACAIAEPFCTKQNPMVVVKEAKDGWLVVVAAYRHETSSDNDWTGWLK